MKPKYIVGALAAIILIVTAVITLQSKKLEYSDFSSAQSSGRRVQIAGTWIKEKKFTYDTEKNEFRFSMRDTTGREMPVVHNGAKPNNFEMAKSLVVTGTIENGQVNSSNILTKCPSKYESDGTEIYNDGSEKSGGGY